VDEKPRSEGKQQLRARDYVPRWRESGEVVLAGFRRFDIAPVKGCIADA
jgi:hypothetical protein